MKDEDQGQKLKNMIIYERSKNQDTFFKQKLQKCSKIWKYIQTQYLYKNLKNFLLNKELVIKNEDLNKQVEYNIHAHCQKKAEEMKESVKLSNLDINELESSESEKEEDDNNRGKIKTIKFKNNDMENIDVFRNEIVIEEDDQERLTASIIEKNYEAEN